MTNYERENEISTDEIINRLEHCVKRGNRNYDTDIVLDLINRQKAEIERLNKKVEELSDANSLICKQKQAIEKMQVEIDRLKCLTEEKDREIEHLAKENEKLEEALADNGVNLLIKQIVDDIVKSGLVKFEVEENNDKHEKIKNMSVQEMAEWLDEILSGNSCYLCSKKDIDKCGYWKKDLSDRIELCEKNRQLWLESEVEEIWQGKEATITLVPLQETRLFKVDASEINKTVFDSKVEALINVGLRRKL